MTIDDKRNYLIEFCNSFKHCHYGCPLEDAKSCDWDDDEVCEQAYAQLTAGKLQEDVPTPDPNANVDIVNHPPHYCREGSMECIEEMELIFGKEAVKHFCLCNAWKYRYRSSAKNGEEDIKKSDWYIRKYRELTSNE